MQSILQDSGLENISNVLNTKLEYSESVIKSMLLKSCNFPSISDMIETQNIIEILSITEDLQPYFDQLETKEKECKKFFEEHNNLESINSLEKDTYGQLIFTNEYFKSFNHIPFFIILLAYFKKICIPLISLVFPLLAYFLPMIMIKYIWKLPINLDMYNKIMGKIWSFDISSPEKILQNLFTVFTLSQSIYQIIQNALHLHTIDMNIVSIGKSIQDYNEIVLKIKGILKKHSVKFTFSKTFNDLYDDSRRIFVQLLEEPYRFILVAKDMAKLEVFWKLAKHPDICKVQLFSSETPYLKADSLYDINLSKESTNS